MGAGHPSLRPARPGPAAVAAFSMARRPSQASSSPGGAQDVQCASTRLLVVMVIAAETRCRSKSCDEKSASGTVALPFNMCNTHTLLSLQCSGGVADAVLTDNCKCSCALVAREKLKKLAQSLGSSPWYGSFLVMKGDSLQCHIC